MEIVKKIDAFLQTVDSKDFYKYLAVIIGIITALLGVLGWYYYSSTREYLAQIQEINEQRENQVQELFGSHERIIMEQKQVNELLDQNPNFKILGFFNEVLNNLGIAQKRVSGSTSSIERENYRESVLNVTLAAMNMQELCELLEALEQSKRIFTKDLDIQKSKTSDAIDVTLTIATLQPKTAG